MMSAISPDNPIYRRRRRVNAVMLFVSGLTLLFGLTLTAGFAALAPIDQLGLLSDSWALGMAGLQPASSFLDLARATRGDGTQGDWMFLTSGDSLQIVLSADQPTVGGTATYQGWGRLPDESEVPWRDVTVSGMPTTRRWALSAAYSASRWAVLAKMSSDVARCARMCASGMSTSCS